MGRRIGEHQDVILSSITEELLGNTPQRIADLDDVPAASFGVDRSGPTRFDDNRLGGDFTERALTVMRPGCQTVSANGESRHGDPEGKGIGLSTQAADFYLANNMSIQSQDDRLSAMRPSNCDQRRAGRSWQVRGVEGWARDRRFWAGRGRGGGGKRIIGGLGRRRSGAGNSVMINGVGGE